MSRPAGFTLSTSTAAKIIGVHPKTLIRWAKAGKVAHWLSPSFTNAGRRYYFARDDIEALSITLNGLQQEQADEPKHRGATLLV